MAANSKTKKTRENKPVRYTSVLATENTDMDNYDTLDSAYTRVRHISRGFRELDPKNHEYRKSRYIMSNIAFKRVPLSIK